MTTLKIQAIREIMGSFLPMESGKNRAASREKASQGQPQHRLGNNLTKRAQSHCTRARQAGTAIARHPTDSSDKKQSKATIGQIQRKSQEQAHLQHSSSSEQNPEVSLNRAPAVTSTGGRVGSRWHWSGQLRLIGASGALTHCFAWVSFNEEDLLVTTL